MPLQVLIHFGMISSSDTPKNQSIYSLEVEIKYTAMLLQENLRSHLGLTSRTCKRRWKVSSFPADSRPCSSHRPLLIKYILPPAAPLTDEIRFAVDRFVSTRLQPLALEILIVWQILAVLQSLCEQKWNAPQLLAPRLTLGRVRQRGSEVERSVELSLLFLWLI